MKIKNLITQDYIDDLSVRLSHHSTAIEGNKISYSDTATIILEGTIPNSNISKRDFYEVDNHAYAIKTMFDFLVNDEKLTLNIIKELNEKLMYKLHHNAGKFKTNDNAIKGADFNTASVEQTPILMYQWINNLEYRLNNTNDSKEKLKIILESHIEFERIHPFSDGNGRTGRLIMIYLLLQEDIYPFVIKVDNRDEYIKILRNQDIEKFITMALNLQEFEEKKIKGLKNNLEGNIESENMEKIKIFLATGNKHKIEEISDIFSEIKNIEILSTRDGIKIPEVIEDGETFEENSAKKAKEIAEFLNMITIADDSGLCVEALNGEPGVYSARYSEEGTDKANNEKLIKNLKNIENRKAKFVSVISLAKPNKENSKDIEIFSFRGEVEGEIIDEARGTTGFGYDPHFFVEEYNKTLAELPEIKNKISHRANALKKLKQELKNILN